jgi:hypothetical protein
VKVFVDKNPTYKGLLADILRAMGIKKIPRTWSGDQRLDLLIDQIIEQKTKVIAFDETQHISEYRSREGNYTAADVIKSLVKAGGVQIICCRLLSNAAAKIQVIVDDAMKVAKETTFVMAEEAIAETMDGEVSGPAAAKLREGLSAFGMRRGETEFDTKTLREATETLTFNGAYWSLVRPGVICTKGLGEYGPCTKSHRAPDPGACRTTCGHRLETSRAKQNCEDALRALAKERANAASDGAEPLLAHIDGQILAQLKRWDDVRERVLSAHPDIRSLWEGDRTGHERQTGRKDEGRRPCDR